MKVKKIASGPHIKKFGSAGGKKIGGGANKKGGALIASPVKNLTIARKGM